MTAAPRVQPAKTVEHIGRRVQASIYSRGVRGHRPTVPTSAVELEKQASVAMSRRARAYINGGAGSEATMSANRLAFAQRRIVPSMLVDTAARDISVELFGTRIPAPLLLAPIGVSQMVDRGADLTTARGAREAGVPMIISTQASYPIERIAAELDGAPFWYQLYFSRDRELVRSFVSRAEAAGAGAIVLTLDTTVLGWRPRDLDLGWLPFARGLGIGQYTSDPVFQSLVDERLRACGGETSERPTPAAVSALLSMAREYPGPALDSIRSGRAVAAVQTFLEVFSKPDLGWADVAWLREITRLPIILKGVQRADDARRALDHGVDGIGVSNHGGRQVDGAIGALAALPAITAAVDRRAPIIFDSGIRTGTDIFKALALGASAVCLGRPYLWGMALAGAPGVTAVAKHIIAEFDLSLALAGISDLSHLDEGVLARD